MNGTRKTKIVATIGPASESEENAVKLLECGVNVFRLNSSHETVEVHRERIERIKKLRARGFHFAILLDLAGPKIRTGRFETEYVTIGPGSTIEILCGEEFIGNTKRFWINYEKLSDEIKTGEKILINDGAISLIVRDVHKAEKRIICEVERGGEITHKRGVNLPGVDISAPSITEKDKEFIKLGNREAIDYFALSFVRKANDIKEVKELTDIPIVAKIETLQALDNLEEIIAVADAVMVARGDLGVEIPIAQVPIAQKRIIEISNLYKKPVITATQMLESMINNATPTRAEVTDISNAILDGTDAIMLSAETSIGKYPCEAVRVMDEVSKMTEKYMEEYENYKLEWLKEYSSSFDTPSAISYAATTLAKNVDAKLMITATSTGATAIHVSKYKPAIPVMAATNIVETYNRLSLVWGVIPVMLEGKMTTDEMIEQVTQKAKELGLASNGDRVVIVAGIPWGKPGTTNTVQIQRIR
ncbi:MAG TPA: pyruvate kinase [Fervidobacterium sp.]|nr:pyruvate kinase [Fervidobacterium sp.]HOK87726.1 pyruvate kinase [Fervidobacterium sp.]HOM74065.1 pyruvate kinase [Fervidobacterium sp.]HPP17677.1 pyruvate kinase [Fervidobacterium sp.]HRD19848.1 pyruvate kinase [Fervidobacterium sp.]